ncbi:MAG TPA: penicillin-binding protein 2 [bacterium]|nr:penicillin-binding protein 2 [bacterium]
MRILKQSEEVKSIYERTRLLLYVILFSFIILIGRVFYLQVIKGDELIEKSRDNFILSEKIFPARGEIFSLDGKVLATTEPSFRISVVPVFFLKPERKEEQIDRISTVLELSKNEKQRFSNQIMNCYGRCRYLPLLIKDEITKDKILSYSGYLTNFPGIIISSTYKRVYPFREKTSHITGYVSKINQNEAKVLTDYDLDDFTGKTGLEKSYEEYLHGRYGETFHIIDHMGRKIEVPENIDSSIPPAKYAVKGNSIKTTILSYLQETAASALGEMSGAVVVMEISSGRILGMYSNPSFDSNLLSRKRIPEKIWREYSQSILNPLVNKVIRQTYFPGSTFKPIPAIAGLHYRKITPASTYLCEGCLMFGTDTKCCWNKGGHGYVNLYRSLKESCDIYYYKLSEEIGLEGLTHFAALFGAGQVTGIDLPGEERGVLPERTWFNLNYPGMRIGKGVIMNLSIGQGDIRMTPLQIAVLYAALANYGVIIKPRIVESIITPEGVVTPVENEIIRVLDIDKKHFESINKALWSVTNEPGGTAYFHSDRTIKDAAGKTGTSQVISNIDRKNIDYTDDERRHMTQDDALFAAFYPYRDPEIVAVAVIEGGGHGGSVAAPVVYKMLKSYHFGRSIIE